MIANQMFLIPRIFFHALIIFDVLENNLAEAIEVRDICHLWVKKVAHQSASSALVVNLNFYIRYIGQCNQSRPR